VFGPREVEVRSQLKTDRAIVKCEYAMAAFSTGEQQSLLLGFVALKSMGRAPPTAVSTQQGCAHSRHCGTTGASPLSNIRAQELL
jgi:hypothetical protein